MNRWVYYSTLAGAGYLMLHYLAIRSLYYPMRHPDGWWEQQSRLGAEDVWLRSAGGLKLHGWWKEAPGARVATVFLHGNAGNVTHRGMHMHEIAAAGSSVLVVDYRGYGRSEGKPTESGLYADGDAAFEWVAAKGLPVVIHGESLGSAVAVDVASRKQCAGVVLETPFNSARAAAGRVLPLIGPLLIWSYDSKAKIGRVKAPLLVIHGNEDEVIHYSLGRDLFAAANDPKEHWTVEGGHHNDLVETAGPRYRERLSRFYEMVRQRL